ncbi:hypothetical protein [Maricaulis sp. CAU 1757]
MSLPEVEFGRGASRSIAWTCWGAALALTLVLGLSALNALERANSPAGVIVEFAEAKPAERDSGALLAFEPASEK